MNPKILIVDDSEFAQLKLRKAFEGENFEILPTATSVEEAIISYKKYRPDIVTMDIVMAGTDGVEGVERIISCYPDAKVLMVSAMGQDGLIEEALSKGAKGFIVKPYEDRELVNEVKRILA